MEYKCERMENYIRNVLGKCPLFAGMTPVEIEMSLLGKHYRIVSYGKNDIYALAGMPCKYADIVLKGSLVCRMTSMSGKQVEVSRLREGNLVAPAFIFSKDNAMPVSVETDSPAEVFRMQPAVLTELINTDEKIRMNFIRVLSNIDVFLTEKMKFLSLFSVREKVATLLLQRAREQQTNEVLLERSRQEIADSFGIQKFSLIRALAEFERDGAIKVNGKRITIIDKSKML